MKQYFTLKEQFPQLKKTSEMLNAKVANNKAFKKVILYAVLKSLI